MGALPLPRGSDQYFGNESLLGLLHHRLWKALLPVQGSDIGNHSGRKVFQHPQLDYAHPRCLDCINTCGRQFLSLYQSSKDDNIQLLHQEPYSMGRIFRVTLFQRGFNFLSSVIHNWTLYANVDIQKDKTDGI